MRYLYEHKRRTIIGLGIILTIIVYLLKDASFILRSVSLLATASAFYILDHLFNIKFKIKHYTIVIVTGIITYLFSSFYFIYPQFDKFQHLIVPIFISSILFFMIDKLKLPLKWKLMYTFVACISLLSSFEIAEYGLDYFFELKLQGVYLRDIQGIEKFHLIQEPLDDTMIDIALGIIGSLIYLTYRSIKNYKLLGLK